MEKIILRIDDNIETHNGSVGKIEMFDFISGRFRLSVNCWFNVIDIKVLNGVNVSDLDIVIDEFQSLVPKEFDIKAYCENRKGSTPIIGLIDYDYATSSFMPITPSMREFYEWLVQKSKESGCEVVCAKAMPEFDTESQQWLFETKDNL